MNSEKVLATMVFQKDKRISLYELESEDFKTERERTIFEEIKSNVHGEPRELAVLLSQKNLIDINSFSEQVDKSGHFDSYIQDIKAQSRKKSGQKELMKLMKKYPDMSVNEIHAHMVDIAEKIKMHRETDYSSISDALEETIEDIEKSRRGEKLQIRIPFLEGLILKQNGGELTTIAARPSVGKSVVLLNMAEELAMTGIPVGLISYEMNKKEISNRLLQKYWDKPLKESADTLTDAEMELLEKQKSKYSELPLYIMDKTESYLDTTLGTIDKMIKMDGVKVIFIDYMQLMQVKGTTQNRNLEIGIISRALKNIATENEIVVIAAAQLSRAVEYRDDKKPRLSDLRESGDIENNSDNVIFIYREDVYKNNPEKKFIMELIVGKQRAGGLGTREVIFQAPRQRILRKEDLGYV